MKEKIESILADIFKSHSDRRLDVFKLQVESADATHVKLTGRVLTPDSLESVRKALPTGVTLDTSAVRILRATPGPIYTVATTLTDLHVEPSFLSELFTQVLNGQPLELLEEHPDGKWVYVRQTDGYMGWAYKPYLLEGAPSDDATHVVKAASAHVCSDDRQTCFTKLMMGTRVRVTDERDKWSRVELAGTMVRAGWILSLFLEPLSNVPPANPRSEVIKYARSLTGTYYLWGGSSPFGIDCSGLAQLSHRLAGYTLPRDADLQFKAGTPVDGPYQAGDLFFFHSETNKDRIAHVGICTGGWNMIHSSRSKNGVYEEDVQASEHHKKLFVAAKAYIPR